MEKGEGEAGIAGFGVLSMDVGDAKGFEVEAVGVVEVGVDAPVVGVKLDDVGYAGETGVDGRVDENKDHFVKAAAFGGGGVVEDGVSEE